MDARDGCALEARQEIRDAMSRSSIRVLTLMLLSLAVASCTSRPPQEPTLRYPVKGTVVSVDPEKRRVTVAHEEIPGFMEAMTMPFAVKEDWPFQVLAPGQQVTGTLVVDHGRSWLEDIAVTGIAQDPVGPIAASAEPPAGAEVPDFALMNQDGKPIRLAQYRGRALLVTFIYTRCPLPDYCPRMTGNFAQVHGSMRSHPALKARLHLLSVSFDPGFDTKEVLKAYGGTYVGTGGDAFRDWEFASGTTEQVQAITSYFGLNYWPEKGQIVHSLRTALIGPDGKLLRLYRGSDWTPAQVLRDLKSIE